jgi:ATP-binding protein involved in chromosome partitioning
MQNISIEQILETLKQVKNNHGDDVISLGIVSSVTVRDNNVGFLVNLENAHDKNEAEEIRKICEQKIANLNGVKKVTAVLTSENLISNTNKNIPKPPTPKPITGIKKIIAVASGKGGVGKSTIAANLALALQESGFKVGLVDADIQGPSVAKIMGLSNEPVVENNKMIPPISNGIKCMTMGLLLGENAPVIWRGPMVTKALSQLMLAADWGELDYLIIDLPPGTGDIQLSLVQNYKIDGVVLVSTPQEVALLDVKKATTMFKKLDIKILGIVENMAYYLEEVTGKKIYIFGEGNVKKFCNENNIPIICEVPLNPKISQICDIGLKGNNMVSEILKNNVNKIFN